jgi:hypothetical protein
VRGPRNAVRAAAPTYRAPDARALRHMREAAGSLWLRGAPSGNSKAKHGRLAGGDRHTVGAAGKPVRG